MLSATALRTFLPTLPRIALRGPWYRAVNHDLLTGPPPGARPGSPVQPIWPGGAARKGARFTPRAVAAPGIDCLYLAEDELTPLVEITGVFRPPGMAIPLRFAPQTMMTVEGDVADVLDLTDTAIQGELGTTLRELTAPWMLQQARHLAGLAPPPPTQELGQEAFDTGSIVGLRYHSSKNPSGVGVVVFTSRLIAGRDAIAVFNPNPTGRLQQSLP